ncbi:MAG: PEP-CTERM sorting domain-containing protein [Acidobacteriaceae bacterium]|nr:PEP-CTERM sorting domain-containing protein [Acidobacteriaceae bacterium]
MQKWFFAAVVATAVELFSGLPAQASTVFSNYTGVNESGVVAGLFAASFTPTGNFDFTGAAAFLDTPYVPPATASLILYSSSSAGKPDLQLWRSGSFSITTAQLVSASYTGTPIVLQSGNTYFLGVDTPNGAWVGGGSSSVPFLIYSADGTWVPVGSGTSDVQFEVYGNPVIPEPASFALLGLGLPSVAAVRSRRARHQSS